MTAQELHNLVADSIGNEGNICQICMMRDGQIIYEDCWRGFGLSDAAHVMSVTKSIMALLVGIAIDKGHISDEGCKVLDFFPDFKPKRGEKTAAEVTLRHLLTMTAPYKYRSEPWTKVCTSGDWTLAALDLLGGRAGITGEFKYATLGIQILAGVIENATGEKCIDFANRHLFAPLGIPVHKAHGDSSKEDQLNYVMSKAPRDNEWYTDPKGVVTAGWGLTLSARDMARIGSMVASGGEYGGKRIVSSKWIEMMTTPHIQLGRDFGDMRYGYLWYRPSDDRNVCVASGDGGNLIYVDRDNGIAVGVTGIFKPRIFDRIDFVEKHMLPIAAADKR